MWIWAQLSTYFVPAKFNNLSAVAAKKLMNSNSRTFSIVFLLIAGLGVSAQVKVDTIREVATTLSSAEMEGRGAGQAGGKRAAEYLAEKFAKAGLKAPAGAPSYQQEIKIEVQTLMPGTELKIGSNTFQFKKDFGVAQPAFTELKQATGEIVFVGYGVVSSELKRDDLAGVDVKDKIVMVLSGKPKGINARLWQKESSQRLVFGRLIKKGAAGFIVTDDGGKARFPIVAAVISNRTVSLSEPIKGTTLPARWSLELLVDEFKLPPSVLISESAATKIFEGQSESFAEIKRKAELGQFVSRKLDENASISPRVKYEKETSSNVIGMIEGSDPKLKNEALVYTAHYDAFGVDTEGTIYPGAADNALGVGKLIALAEAFVKLAPRPRRSIIFIATTGEEYGDLGAEYWLQHPTFPIERIAADINFDGSVLEVWGKLAFLLDVGFDLSDLNEIVKSVAATSDIEIYPDPLPDEGFFYRSDHYAFIRKGIPAIFLLGGPAMNPNVLFARARKWQETRYHTPADVIEADWDWEGARMLASFALVAGKRIADQETMPNWKPGSPYTRPSP
jgi:peptidase M28-like protein